MEKIKNWAIKEPKDKEIIQYLRDLPENKSRYHINTPNYYFIINGQLDHERYMPNEYTLLTEQQFKEQIMGIFVLPEKWFTTWSNYEEFRLCVTQANLIRESRSIHTKMDDTHYMFYSCENHYLNSEGSFVVRQKLIGYKEITFEEFQKYVNKEQNNMKEREIIGYLAPYDMWNNTIKKGEIFVKSPDNKHSYKLKRSNNIDYLPKEIVETWEPVYKAQEEVYNMGSFNLTIKPEGIFHNKTENITKFVKELIEFYNKNRSFEGFSTIIEEIKFAKTGCQHNNTKLTDWNKVYDIYKNMQ